VSRHSITGKIKGQGLKTEPTFATVFALPGDPYQTLLALADLSEEALMSVITHTPHTAPKR